MTEVTKKELNEEIHRLTCMLPMLKPEEDEYISVVNRLTSLCSLIDSEEKSAHEGEKIALDRERMNLENSSHGLETVAKTAVDVGSVVVPLIFYSWLAAKGFHFEETGCISSFTFKNFWSFIKPKK